MRSKSFNYFMFRFLRLSLPLIASIAAGVTLFTFTKQLNITTKPGEKSINESMFEYLEKGIDNNLFDEEFCKTAFNHFDRKSDGNLLKYGYVETLEDFIVYLHSKDDKHKEEQSGNEKYIAVTNLLKKAKETEPFASLPAEEKRLMNNVQLFIQKEDVSNALNTLNELKQVILVRHKEYQKIERQNSWSIPLAFIGIILTFVFGAWGTILAIRKEQRIIFNDMKVKNH